LGNIPIPLRTTTIIASYYNNYKIRCFNYKKDSDLLVVLVLTVFGFDLLSCTIVIKNSSFRNVRNASSPFSHFIDRRRSYHYPEVSRYMNIFNGYLLSKLGNKYNTGWRSFGLADNAEKSNPFMMIATSAAL
jgi:hypothetical protein